MKPQKIFNLFLVIVFCAGLLLVPTQSASATTCPLHVTTTGNDTTGNGSQASPFRTIQYAIDNAGSCDMIWVGPGTYTEHINFNGKNLKVISTAGKAQTIIDATHTGRPVTFANGEDPTTLLKGFTLTNGRVIGSHGGGLIMAYNSAPTIEDVDIINNFSDRWGGAVSCFEVSASPTQYGKIINSRIVGNEGAYGGAVHCNNYDLTLINVEISGNKSQNTGGGAVQGRAGADLTLVNVTISGNKDAGYGGGGVELSSNSTVNITNSIIYGNLSVNGGAANNSISFFDSTVSAVVSYSDIEAGWSGAGNVDVDPKFVSPVAPAGAPSIAGDYHLQPTSPVIDAGNNSAVTLPTDLDGNARLSGAAVDMGAYEAPCQPYTKTFTAGVHDSFSTANGPEKSGPSAALLAWINGYYAIPGSRDFDAFHSDQFFGQTFDNLNAPGHFIKSAKLEIAIHNGDDNDSLALSFGSGSAWGIPLANIVPLGSSKTVTLDLAALPPYGAYPTNLVAGLMSNGFVDILVQDDSAVDYADLTVEYGCQCQSYTRTFTAGVHDIFSTANGAEKSGPSAALLAWINGYYAIPGSRDFDASHVDQFFGQTFDNLNVPGYFIKSARLEIAIYNGDDNESLALSFGNGPVWGIPLSDFVPMGSSTTFNLDLAHLPPHGTAPTDLVADLASNGFLNVLVQDDSAVDYADLTVEYGCQCQSYSRTFPAGVHDDFSVANGAEKSGPSADLLAWINANYAIPGSRDFDASHANQFFGQTFDNLNLSGHFIKNTWLKIAISNGAASDSLALSFANGPVWGIPLANIIPMGSAKALSLNLADLPLYGTYPTNLVTDLASNGFLNVLVQDDSAVDYADLTVEYGCQAPPMPTHTPTQPPTAIPTIPITHTPTKTPGIPITPTRAPTKAQTIVTLQSIAAQDGWILESTETSNVGGALNSSAATFNLGDDAARKQYRGILSFSTGPALSDNAVITGVTLKVKQQAILGGGNPVTLFQGFMFDVKNGFFGSASTLQTGDFQAAASQSYGPSAPAPAGGWYSFNLTNAKLLINKLATNSGLTQIRLRLKLDDNNNAIANYLSLYSGNAPAASRPQLVITYTIP